MVLAGVSVTEALGALLLLFVRSDSDNLLSSFGNAKSFDAVQY